MMLEPPLPGLIIAGTVTTIAPRAVAAAETRDCGHSSEMICWRLLVYSASVIEPVARNVSSC
jgi:hypothetical protein